MTYFFINSDVYCITKKSFNISFKCFLLLIPINFKYINI